MQPAELNHILNALSNKDISHTPQTDFIDTHHPVAIHRCVLSVFFGTNIGTCVLYTGAYYTP